MIPSNQKKSLQQSIFLSQQTKELQIKNLVVEPECGDNARIISDLKNVGIMYGIKFNFFKKIIVI